MIEVPKHLTNLASAFGKDVFREDLLAELNELTAPLQKQLEQRGPPAPQHPVVFVLGPPRGGTTLASQLISTSGLFGTVCNLAARFWEAPAFGLLLARALGIADEAKSHFRSQRGVTEGWGEPSEFGYFWSRYFDLGQPTHQLDDAGRARFDAIGLRHAVAAMEAVAGRPMAFKNNTWFTFHADLLVEIFPGAVLVACRRDPFFVAQSLYMQRLELYGDPSRWWSVRPPDYADIVELSPIEQVAAQAVSIGVEMERSLARVRDATVIDSSYRRLVEEPRAIVREVALAARIETVAIVAGAERAPTSFGSTDVVQLPTREEQELRRAIDLFNVQRKLVEEIQQESDTKTRTGSDAS